ncbi:hypothetical protein [Bacteroides heparinolyticus]|uniref:hypothetical protein n=1 Tax=Prevotella heparinolytica TaxID=28113 RepID=UPI00359FED01
MKKLALIIATLVVTTTVTAQSKVYRNSVGSPEQHLFVSLTLDSLNYALELCFDNDDLLISNMLSFGHHIDVSNDTMVLCDQMNGYKTVLKVQDDGNLFLEKGFSAITPIRLSYSHDSKGSPVKLDFDLCDVLLERKDYASQTDLRDFANGLYEVCHPGCSNALALYGDSLYSYSIGDDFKLSEGRWERNGNLLVFYDKCLGEAFTALIEDGYIFGNRFPGDHARMRYRIIPEDEYDDIPFPMIPNKDYNPNIIHR